MALAKGGLPKEAGTAPVPSEYFGNLTKVLIGTAVAIPIFVILVSGLSVIPGFDSQVTMIPDSVVEPMEHSDSPLVKGMAEFVKEASRPAGLVLILAGLGATIYLLKEAFSMDKIARERMFVVFILTFFSLLFWAFFEQSGSSVNNFTDRNVDRVTEATSVTDDLVGTTQRFSLTATQSSDSEDLDFFSQEFLGHENGSTSVNATLDRAIRGVDGEKEEDKRMSAEELLEMIAEVQGQEKMTMTAMTYLREYAKSEAAAAEDKVIEWKFTEENVGKIGLGGPEIPASVSSPSIRFTS